MEDDENEECERYSNGDRDNEFEQVLQNHNRYSYSGQYGKQNSSSSINNSKTKREDSSNSNAINSSKRKRKHL